MLSRGMTWENIAILRKFDSSIAILQTQVDDAVLENETWLKQQTEQTMKRYEEMRRPL
jgi:hypothetical protein